MSDILFMFHCEMKRGWCHIANPPPLQVGMAYFQSYRKGRQQISPSPSWSLKLHPFIFTRQSRTSITLPQGTPTLWICWTGQMMWGLPRHGEGGVSRSTCLELNYLKYWLEVRKHLSCSSSRWERSCVASRIQDTIDRGGGLQITPSQITRITTKSLGSRNLELQRRVFKTRRNFSGVLPISS